jgi:hypothetical protein
MRRYHFLSAAGTLCIIAAFVVLHLPSVRAQDSPGDPPFLPDYYNAWAGSAHANAEAEAFVHWNSEGEVPVECARCHSTTGYRDFLGDDGTAAGEVDNPAPLGTVVSCDACHSSSATTLTTITFPSSASITDTGDATRCMVCHQGRASTDSVNAAIEKAGLTQDRNKVSPDMGFINIHYFAAAATLYGSEARGGYQYDGQNYQMKNLHVPAYDTCSECHNPHTLEVRVEECAGCHEDVESVEDLRLIRMNGTQVDYDGDGDMDEGIAEEIQGLQSMLYEAMQSYARDVAGTPLAYKETAYPYFFVDTNDNGDVDDDEAVSDNAFKAFTANLLTAAYNYQVTIKDPGGFAHNPTYHIQLLFDSISALNAELSKPLDMEFMHRNDPGHFNTVDEPFRHWDADGEVPGTCARCHTSGGLPIYLKNGVNIAAPPSNSLACSTCHDSIPEFTTYVVDEVRFPSGATVTFGEGEESNLCLNCHQGRESTVSVNTAITRAGVGDDEVSESLAFRNVHYFAAGASLFGGEVQGGYQYEGKEYSGRNLHAEDAPTTCTGCHFEHEPSNRLNECEDCHEEVEEQEDVRLIRMEPEGVDPVDYDGDGDAAEPILDEITTMQEALLANIQSYASGTIGTAIVYSPTSYPYWFIDTNGDGVTDAEEVKSDNGYATWTPTLLRAAYNYQYSQKDPGGFAHNSSYIMQMLYDSTEAAGGDVSKLTRPPVVADGS